MDSKKKPSYTFHHVKIAPKEQIGKHKQDTWELSWIVTGAGIRVIGDKTERFASGEVIFIPPEIPHCWYFDTETTNKKGQIVNVSLFWEDDFLNVCADCFSELHAYCQKIKELTSALKFCGEKSDTIISILKKMQKENEAERIASIIKLIVTIVENDDLQSIVGRYQQIDKEKKRLNDIRIFIVCNYKRNITLTDIARHVGMNRASFCTFFKKVTGKTFISYLNEHRIELACQLLENSKYNIAEICLETGFNDLPYFNRIFKRITNVSPTTYRREHNNNMYAK